ncbi:MAG: hypothetical protein KBS91_03350, partial [Firmicutes bacterium]|nr:hypothetical protein [Candidatus Caballimonas caccae]
MIEEEKLEENENGKKKRNWIAIAIVSLLVAGILAWCIYNIVVVPSDKVGNVYGISQVVALSFGIFFIAVLGYLLGSIEIKGVSLGTAGVFLVAIAFGCLSTISGLKDVPILKNFFIDNATANATDASKKMYTYYSSIVQNIGLILFVASVGFIAGPKFFKNLKANAKSYVLLGVVIIVIGAICAVIFALILGEGYSGKEFSVGVLSGALTTTPGYSAALEAAGSVEKQAMVTLGHAIAYPFGVVGVVLFVQLMPKFLKADMEIERGLLVGKVNHKHEEKKKKFYEADPFGLTPFAFAVILGLLVGAIKIPLTGDGYNGTCFSLGNTGGVLIMCLVCGHFGHIGKLSLEIPKETAKIFREFGLMLFLIGAGVAGGAQLVTKISEYGGEIIAYGFLGGIVMTLAPMIVGYFFAAKVLHLPLLNNLGSITGGMTSTPALGTLVKVAGSDDVASAYAATYPVALVLIVLASQFIVTLM